MRTEHLVTAPLLQRSLHIRPSHCGVGAVASLHTRRTCAHRVCTCGDAAPRTPRAGAFAAAAAAEWHVFPGGATG
jgi:hypothetical protein